ARNGSAGLSIGTKGYIGLGNNTNSTSNFRDFYEYDPANDSWSRKSDFPIPYVVEPCTYSSSASGYVLCGYYYQFSGINHNPLNMFYRYDQQADAWSLEGTFPGLPRGYAGGFALNNDLYIGCGGQTNTLAPGFSDFWKLSNGISLSVENINGQMDFSVYPNPSSHTFYLGTELTGKKADHLRIYDSSGRLIADKKLNNPKAGIDISDYQCGLYFIELITGNGEVLDSRFVKQ
ncbi:MAG TPA: T9SS type A sorting domain-containing protein, partial [Bacteroidia bacterium]|nr:T9SS type A sorting domain-containing protein [Bacteroidia bacterium]